MSKQFWLIVIAIVVVLVGIFTLTGNNSPGSSSSNSSKPTSHLIGLGKSGVVLVEYGDYQCPYCGEYASTLSQVVTKYYNRITFQFRNFPLTSIHQNAFAGARAAEAAGLMGKFWQMHDLLYQQNQEYYNSNGSVAGWIGASDPEPVLAQDAVSLGLNKAKFEQLYASDQVNNLITADENTGTSLNINATPTFFIDGKTFTANNTVQAFSTVIDAAIAQKAGQNAASTSTSTSTTNQPQSKQ
ncbi:MAG TPA: thioredoxin domain-containing protein [Candidatus Saccharimonadales bacterium]